MTSRKFRKNPSTGFAQYPDSVFKEQGTEELSQQLIKQARRSGQLNLSNRGLAQVPERVWTLMELDQEEQKQLASVTMDNRGEEAWWDTVELTKLILACNSISLISPSISNLCSLTSLDIHDNQLQDLPHSVGELKLINRLNLSHNKLKAVPEGIFMMKDLRVLQLNNNQIETISDSISEIDMVNHLDLANNQLKELPGNFGYLSKLSKLNLSNNLLESLPNEMNSLTMLSFLDLTNNKLISLPPGMGELSHLEVLYLRQNRLEEVPRLTNCVALKEVHLGSNQITSITSNHLENIVNVATLDLRDNKVTSLPPDMTVLASLERLDLTNNSLANLPPSLGLLPHLKAVAVEGNPMKSIRRDILARGTIGLLKYLRSRLEEGEMQQLASKVETGKGGHVSPPPVLAASPPIPDKFTMKTSQSLNLSSKGLITLPDEAVSTGVEAGVLAVDLSKNSFSEFPSNLEPLLPSLHELNISRNKLCSVPDLLATCSLLSFLDLSNNKLSSLPPSMGSLPHLREIILSVNSFTSIPPPLYSCAKLETILIANNQINTLDIESLSKLTNLAILDLQNNALQTIPPELGKVTQIRTLQLEGNLFRVPRTAILVQGTAAVMAYLRDRIPQ